MAILKVTNELDSEEWFQRLLKRDFNNIESLIPEPNLQVYRIQHEEIPKEDKQISFQAIKIGDGIEPIIIKFDL